MQYDYLGITSACNHASDANKISRAKTINTFIKNQNFDNAFYNSILIMHISGEEILHSMISILHHLLQNDKLIKHSLA